MAASGKYKSVHLNQKISTITGGKNPSGKQPDVAGVRHDDKVDVVDVLSGDQSLDGQVSKYEDALGSDAGDVRAIPQDPK